jgi:hypothetical protein
MLKNVMAMRRKNGGFHHSVEEATFSEHRLEVLDSPCRGWLSETKPKGGTAHGAGLSDSDECFDFLKVHANLT